ncbi:hypothetical protein N8574_01840 [Akkermansiaceae bacterium]|nr:hypothetical protein [Akkermansiaceae bacterium]
MTELRLFKQKGREEWSKWLEKLRDQPNLSFPDHLLLDPTFTQAAPCAIKLLTPGRTQYDLARKLATGVELIEKKGLLAKHWPGLWDWLAAYYFNDLCPLKSDGSRKVRALAHYRLDGDYRRSYRHLIYGPVSRFRSQGDCSKIFLSGPPSRFSDWAEQTASRQEIGGNAGIAEALCILYWDDEKQAPKRGAAPNRKVAGTLRRFVAIMKQLALNYDLNGVSAQGLIDLLPREFDGWKPSHS